LPPEVRDLLADRMQRHREEAGRLMTGALFLDYEGVDSAAADIIGEPQLPRPSPNEQDTLNARLPEHFFILQDQLVARARELRSAAASHDGNLLAAAYGALSQTCVACHSAYLHENPHP
jgi:cytochrome c556